MATSDKFIILAADPDEGVWSIVLQTTDQDQALDFWAKNQNDPSKRIMLNTADFITFPIGGGM